jgi:hypothetical protein
VKNNRKDNEHHLPANSVLKRSPVKGGIRVAPSGAGIRVTHAFVAFNNQLLFHHHPCRTFPFALLHLEQIHASR